MVFEDIPWGFLWPSSKKVPQTPMEWEDCFGVAQILRSLLLKSATAAAGKRGILAGTNHGFWLGCSLRNQSNDCQIGVDMED